MLDLVNAAIIKKPKPGPGVRISGAWLDGIVAYEEANQGALARFITSDEVKLEDRQVALSALMRYFSSRPGKASDMLDAVEAILDHNSADDRFAQIKMDAIEMGSRTAGLKKDNPMYKRGLELFIRHFDSENDHRILAAVLSAMTKFSEPAFLIPRLKERLGSLDLEDEYNLPYAVQIVNTIGALWSLESDEFIKKTAVEHPHFTLRRAAIRLFRNKTREFAVPFLKKCLETEKHPDVINDIKNMLRLKGEKI
ncbi:MAG: hypothetical protein ACYS8W_19115 [Planctomycetota bacterium]